jgi:hypothetical protein
VSEVLVELASDSSCILVAVPLRNIGAGVALITGVGLRTASAEHGGQVKNAVVAPQEMTMLYTTVGVDLSGLSTFSAEVRYTDGADGASLRTRADLHNVAGRWRVRQIALFHGDDADPFAMSGPSD